MALHNAHPHLFLHYLFHTLISPLILSCFHTLISPLLTLISALRIFINLPPLHSTRTHFYTTYFLFPHIHFHTPSLHPPPCIAHYAHSFLHYTYSHLCILTTLLLYYTQLLGGKVCRRKQGGAVGGFLLHGQCRRETYGHAGVWCSLFVCWPKKCYQWNWYVCAWKRECVCVCLMGMCVCSALYSYVDLENGTHGIGMCVCERECVLCVCVRERECVCVWLMGALVCSALYLYVDPEKAINGCFSGGNLVFFFKTVPLPPCSLFGHHPKKKTPLWGGFLSI